MFFLYLIPLLNAIFAFLCVYYFISAKKKDLRRSVEEYLNNEELTSEIDPLLDQKLDSLIVKLKAEMPMASLFLSGTFVQKMKGKAKEELLEVVPELKTRVFTKILESDEFPSLMSKKAVIKISVIAALIGFGIAFFPIMFLMFR